MATVFSWEVLIESALPEDKKKHRNMCRVVVFPKSGYVKFRNVKLVRPETLEFGKTSDYSLSTSIGECSIIQGTIYLLSYQQIYMNINRRDCTLSLINMPLNLCV